MYENYRIQFFFLMIFSFSYDCFLYYTKQNGVIEGCKGEFRFKLFVNKSFQISSLYLYSL